jgi:hypothetical protein
LGRLPWLALFFRRALRFLPPLAISLLVPSRDRAVDPPLSSTLHENAPIKLASLAGTFHLSLLQSAERYLPTLGNNTG